MGIRAVTVVVLVSLSLGQGLSQETQPQTIIATLQQGLADPDRGVRFAAAQALGKCADPAVIPALMATLSDEEWCVRAQGAHSLRALGEQAVPVLAAALGSDDMRVRHAAATALARMGDAAREALRPALKDENERIRYVAARGIGDEAVVPALRGLLPATDTRIGLEAARLLTDLGHGADAVPTLLEALRTYRGLPGPEVARILERTEALGAPEAEVLIEIRLASQEDRYRVRDAIERLIIGIGKPAEKPLLTAIDREKDQPKVRMLVRLLEKLKEQGYPTEKYVPPSEPLADEKLLRDLIGPPTVDSDPRFSAELLAWHPACRPRLLEILTTEPSAKYALDALLAMEGGVPATTAEATPLLTAGTPQARRLGIRALRNLLPMERRAAMTQLLEDPDENVRACARWALSPEPRKPEPKIPEQPTVAELVARLSDPDLAVSLSAADALPARGEAAALPLATAMTTGHYGVLHYAEWIFMQLGEKGAPAVDTLVPLVGHEDVNVREVAIRCLGEIGPGAGAAIPALVNALRDIRISVRGRAAVALGRVGPAAEPALLLAAKDTDARVRAGAVYALGWILGARNGIRQEATDLRLPVAEPGPAAETGFVPDAAQFEKARSLSAAKDRKEVKKLLEDLPRAEAVAILRAGLRLSDVRAAVACASALDVPHLDAWEAERCIELLLPEVFSPEPPTSFGWIYEYLGSSEVGATLGYLALSDISDYDRTSDVLGACHRIVRWDLLPELYRLRDSMDAWVVDSDWDIWMPRYWSDRYREQEGPAGPDDRLPGPLRAMLEGDTFDTHLVNCWLNDSVPGPADAEVLLRWGEQLRDDGADTGSLAAVLRAMGHLNDRETERFLLSFFAQDDTAGHFARSALARRGDPDALLRLREDAEVEWLPLSLLMEVRPDIGAEVPGRQMREGDRVAPGWEIGRNFAEIRWHGARWPDDIFDGIEQQVLAADLGPKRLALIAMRIPGCRTRRMAAEILSKLPAAAEQFMENMDDATWYEGRELHWPRRNELIAFLHAAEPSGVIALLRTWARAESGDLRWFALDTLQAIGDPQSAALLLESLPDRTARSPEPEYIFRNLGRSGSPEIERLLIDRIENPGTHETLRQDCLRELAIMYGLPGPDAWPRWGPEEDEARIKALTGKVLARRPVQGVIEFMRGRDPKEIRLAVLGSLTGSPEAHEFLTESAGRRESLSYPEVLGQLARLGDEKARQELWSGFRAGRYRWICYQNEYPALTLGWDPETYPALLAETESNCCRGGHVARMFEELMGDDTLGWNPKGQDLSPIRNAREWLRLYGGRWVRTPFEADTFSGGRWTLVPK